MELQQIIEAIKADPKIAEGILPTISESEAYKKAVENKAEAIFKSKIDEEVNKTHSRYDEDIFAVLGERPEQREDGTKEKTYEKAKKLFEELKTLRGKKDSLTKEAEVQRLTAEIENLKKEGGGKFIQEQFEQAKAQWNAEKTELQKLLKDKEAEIVSGQIGNIVATGFAGLQTNPDISDTIKSVILDNEKARIIKNSKIENGKVVFLTEDGKPLLNPTTYEPMTITEVLSSSKAIQEITLKKQGTQGGGADPIVKGALKTVKVDGKDEKSLELPAGAFKSKKEFIEVAEKALIDAGVTRNNPEWDTLKNKAYKDYNVYELPSE